MANEPEREIEKLLRAAAGKRRDELGPPFELPPATRRLLQGEASRRFARRPPERLSFAQRVRLLSPRLVESFVIIALVAVVASLFWPKGRRAEPALRLARNEPSASPALAVKKAAPLTAMPAPPIPAPAAPAASAPPPSPPQPVSEAPVVAAATADKDAAATRLRSDVSAAASRETENKASPELAKTPGALSGGNALAFKTFPATASSAVIAGSATNAVTLDNFASAPSTSAAAPAELAIADEPKQNRGEQALRQYFFRAQGKLEARRGLANDEKKGTQVLSSFQIEQSGSELKVIDCDGSVYRGTLQSSALPSNVPGAISGSAGARAGFGQARAARPAVAADTVREGGAGYLFRVSGTNQTLGQRVVFSGNLVAADDARRFWRLKTSPVVTNAEAPSTDRKAAGPLLDAPLSGKLTIGKGKPVDILAVPVQSPPPKP